MILIILKGQQHSLESPSVLSCNQLINWKPFSSVCRELSLPYALLFCYCWEIYIYVCIYSYSYPFLSSEALSAERLVPSQPIAAFGTPPQVRQIGGQAQLLLFSLLTPCKSNV